MSSLHLNDRGGITHASQQRIGVVEQRTEILSDVRMVCDALQELCAEIRKSWPERTPMPADLAAMLKFQDFALAKVRGGCLKRFAEACAE
ncbi:MAG: hypothetical protein ROZ09_15070 [Thiobacillus sp.]|uniref:hypothetical protein n=1 Tax=Thiobacillus sp. TaxID=924 RepID=UPI002893A473|nr:hypothetical protein [Thiobacillus sp.]MDT3708142.1 hypothetical protein [Thiobacillus sp.]